MTHEGKRRWRRNKEPPTEQERSEARIRVHARYLRKLRRRRVWRRRAQSIDPQKWPFPLLRWLAVLGLAIAWWVAGAKTISLQDWVPYAAVAGALILPDIAGFAIGGFRLDLKQAQEEIATLRQDVNAQARAAANASVGPISIVIQEAKPGLEAYGGVVGAERDPQGPYVRRHLDTGTTTEVTSEL